MLYIILRGCWCDIIVLNVHAPTEDKIDDVKDMFYKELERIFNKFHKYHTKILLGDFSVKVGRKDMILFRGREVLYNICIEFGVPMKLVRLIKMCLN
jgi:hypothetical protein